VGKEALVEQLKAARLYVITCPPVASAGQTYDQMVEAACLGGAVSVRSWSLTHVEIVTRSIPRGCLLRVLIPNTAGWHAKFRPARGSSAHGTPPTAPVTGNAASMAFELPIASDGSAVVDIDFSPAIILPVAAGISCATLVSIIVISLWTVETEGGHRRKRRKRKNRTFKGNDETFQS